MAKVDSSVPLMHHDLTDLGSLILIETTQKERKLRGREKMFRNETFYLLILGTGNTQHVRKQIREAQRSF